MEVPVCTGGRGTPAAFDVRSCVRDGIDNVALTDVLKEWWAREAPYYVVHDVPSAAVWPVGDTGASCQAGAHYFRVWLAEMRLAQDQSWFTSRHPAVHALVRLRFGDQDVELPRIAGPMTLPGLDQAHLGAVVHLDHPLTPLLPYNGGVVEVSAGLTALEGSNVLREFVSAVDAVTQVLAQPPLSAALAAVGPVTRAVQTLLGAATGRQHLGVHVAYAGDQAPHALHAGYLAVVRCAATQLPVADLSVQQGVLRYRGAPLSGVDYMLFRIERMVERDDWDSLASIATPFRDALTALSHGNAMVAEAHVRRAMLEAWTSPDLTRADRTRVCGEIKRAYQDARNVGLGLEGATPTLAGAMAGALSGEHYLQLQPPSLEAVLDLDA